MLDFMINWTSVIVATIVAVIIGCIWYMPLFGKQWMKLSGVKNMGNKDAMWGSMIGMIIGTLISVWALAVVLATAKITMLGDAILAGVFVWFGFFVYQHAGEVLWQGKPWALFALNAAQTLIAIVVAAAIIVLL